MASRTALLITAAMAVVVVGALLPATASAAFYWVGNDDGWALGVDYDAWATGKNFSVGDTLVFVYPPAGFYHHTVVLLDDAGSYEACTVTSNARTMTSGNDLVTLASAGQYLFICGFQYHCQDGMKLAINVQ